MCEKRIIWHGGAAADSPHRGEPAATRGKRRKGRRGAERSGGEPAGSGGTRRGCKCPSEKFSSGALSAGGAAGAGRAGGGAGSRSAQPERGAPPPRGTALFGVRRAARGAAASQSWCGLSAVPASSSSGLAAPRPRTGPSPRWGWCERPLRAAPAVAPGPAGGQEGRVTIRVPVPLHPPTPPPPAQGAPGPRCPEGRSAAACRERRGTAGCGPGGGSAGSCSGAGRCGDGGAARGGGTARCVLRCVTARGEPRPCSSGHSLKLRSIARRSRSHGPEVEMCAPAAPRHLLAAVSRMSVRWVLLSLVPFCLPRAAAGCPGCSAPFPRGAPRMGPRGPSRGHGLSPSSSRGCPTSLLPPPAAAAAELLTGSVAQEVKAGEGPLGIGDCWQTGAGRSWECIPPCSQTAEQLSIPRRAARGNGSMDSRDHEVGEEQGQRR